MKIVLVLPHLTRIGGAARYAWELYSANAGVKLSV